MNIRLMPSRELSVIDVEVPVEFHVPMTTLFYGRCGLVVPAPTAADPKAQMPYGVQALDLEEAMATGTVTAEVPLANAADSSAATVSGCASPTIPSTAAAPQLQMATCRVGNVRSMPSRGMTRIELEIPCESHRDAVTAFFDTDVLVVPANLPVSAAFGMRSLPDSAPAQGQATTPVTAATTSSSAGVSPRPGPRVVRRGGLGLMPRVDAVKWLGIHCAEAAFQEWLSVRTEAAAKDKVREVCKVGSRAELKTDTHAYDRFLTLLYRPFEAHQQRMRNTSSAAAVSTAPGTPGTSTGTTPPASDDHLPQRDGADYEKSDQDLEEDPVLGPALRSLRMRQR